MVQTQFNTKVQTVRTYNALELGISTNATAFCLSDGMIH